MIAASVLLASPLQAHHKPRHNPPGHSKFKGGPGSFKAHNFQGGPPPWAPAHDYRYKRGDHVDVYPRHAYIAPFGINQGNCYRQAVGAVIGAAGGAVIGVIIGGNIGRTLDRIDTACMGQVLEHAPNGETIIWNSPESDAKIRMTPTQTYQQDDGQYCREYQTKVVIGGRVEDAYGKACRQPDGSWKRVG